MNNLVFNETASQLKTIIYGTDSSGNSVPMQIGEGGQMVVGGTVDIGSAITIGGGTVAIGSAVTIGGGTVDIGNAITIGGGTVDIGSAITIGGGTVDIGS
ncbi:MAG: hypothetical protein E7256_09735, partial [Lachnospiraceae bacterium]|nr:hypothetical protein [Lachnospiraceae bacterium]